MSVLPDDQHASAEQLYFAFGSNLHLSQMATRCPESRFIGFAILPSYRFQINQRGFANVVPSPEHQVEGLCYLLSPDDRSSLDRSEGVPTAYQRQTLPIQVYVAPIHLVGRKASEVSRHLYDVRPSTDPKRKDIGEVNRDRPEERLPPSSDRGDRGGNSKATFAAERCGQLTNALVYISNDKTKESRPREEYIDRMNAGIIDAQMLGMSERYIATHLRKYIEDRPLPRKALARSRRESAAHRHGSSDASQGRPSSRNPSLAGELSSSSRKEVLVEVEESSFVRYEVRVPKFKARDDMSDDRRMD